MGRTVLQDLELSIPECFERSVARNPGSEAVRTETCRMTYEELNRLSNRIARAVQRRLNRAEQPVALLVEQGPFAIAAALGALKSGAACVPLDPAFPVSRNSLILQGCQAEVIVTNHQNLSLAHSSKEDAVLVNIDQLDGAFDDRNLRLAISPDSLAYVISTSGSTGVPKGVMQTHRNILRVAFRYSQGLKISARDRLTLLASCSVTASIGNAFSALMNGATLLPFNIKERGVEPLGDWLNRQQITVYHSCPTVFRHFVATLRGEQLFPRLRLIRLGGEQATRKDFELFKKHFSDDCIFVNGYGCSEMSTVWQYCMDKNARISTNLLPVGYPLDGIEYSLLNDRGEEVGIGPIGEIVIKSPYLSPGYWREPELTRRVFDTDPQDPSTRIFRTGDVGYRLPDGSLVHAGRGDFQVKIRGFRIELEEIELALLDLPAIKEAAVAIHEDRLGEKQLVAYVVFHKGRSLETAQLREHLKERLPDYMLPAVYVRLEALPQTPNGKTDRRALPAPETVPQESPEIPAAPRTPVEEVVAAFWAEVLCLPQIGVHDNVFDLGANSLSATQVTSRLRDAFQVELSLRNILEAPTVAELALVLLQDPVQGQNVEKLARRLLELVLEAFPETPEMHTMNHGAGRDVFAQLPPHGKNEGEN